MPAYLVRTIKTHDLVGVFFAQNLLSLAFLIDEVLDPNACEYQVLAPGGVIWDEVAVSIPIPSGDDEDDSGGDDIPWEDARFTESWATAVFYESDKRWRKVNYGLEDLYGIDPELPEPEREPPPSAPSGGSGKVFPIRKRKS